MEIEKCKAYWCKTKKLAKEFLEECKEQGFTWDDGEIISKNTYYYKYRKNTCYRVVHNVKYGSKKYFEERRDTLIEYEGKSERMRQDFNNFLKEFEEYKEMIEKRDYLVRTDFIGILSNYSLIKEFNNVLDFDKQQVNSQNRTSKIIRRIMEFNIDTINYVYDELKKLEEKQKILDEYGE